MTERGTASMAFVASRNRSNAAGPSIISVFLGIGVEYNAARYFFEIPVMSAATSTASASAILTRFRMDTFRRPHSTWFT